MLINANEDSASSLDSPVFEPQNSPLHVAWAIMRDLLTKHFDIDRHLLETHVLLEDAGLDFLEMVDVCLALEKWYGVQVDAVALKDVRTMGELAAVVAQSVSTMQAVA